MALTTETLLVNPDYMKRITQLNGAVDEAYLVPAIILAQDLHLQLLLGTKLLEKVQLLVRTKALVEPYTTLLNEHIRKPLAWWTMVELLPNLYVRLENGSLAIRTSENTTPISENDLHREVQRCRQNAQFYAYRTLQYLQANTNLFSELNGNVNEELQPYQTGYYQNGMEISGGAEPGTLDLRSLILPVNG